MSTPADGASSGDLMVRRCPRCGRNAAMGRFDVCQPCAVAEGWEKPDRVDPLPEALRRSQRRSDEPWWPTFLDVVCAWLNSDAGLAEDDAVAVLKFEPYGTDWAGDTEGGFYAEFELDIEYATSTSVERMHVSGERMESLWKFVMQAWPDPAEVNR